MAIVDNHCEETDVSVGFHPVYTNTRNIQMWCDAIAVDGTATSIPFWTKYQACL